MSALLDRIAQASDIDEYEVEVPEWGVNLLLVSPTMATRSRLMEAQIAARRDIPSDVEEGLSEAEATLRRIDMNQMQFAVIQACAFDPSDRTQVFLPENTERDMEMLGGKNGRVVWTVFEACQKMAGLSNDDEDDEGPIEAGKDGS